MPTYCQTSAAIVLRSVAIRARAGRATPRRGERNSDEQVGPSWFRLLTAVSPYTMAQRQNIPPLPTLPLQDEHRVRISIYGSTDLQ